MHFIATLHVFQKEAITLRRIIGSFTHLQQSVKAGFLSVLLQTDPGFKVDGSMDTMHYFVNTDVCKGPLYLFIPHNT